MLSFQANALGADYDENNVLTIVFSNWQEDGETNHYFMIQHMEEYDEQDAELGMDTYYIERDDPSYSTYGGIRRISLLADQLTVELDESGSKHLAVPQVVIGLSLLSLTEEIYTHLMDQLKTIFDEKTWRVN